MIIYFTRHAEKAHNGADPPISDAGRVRAQVLAHLLRDTNLEVVYATQFRRTQMTGEIVTTELGLNPPVLYDAGDPGLAVTEIQSDFPDANVLIIGHSNTLDDIARILGITTVPELAEHQFDRLFAIHIHENKSRLQRLRYGTPTP